MHSKHYQLVREKSRWIRHDGGTQRDKVHVADEILSRGGQVAIDVEFEMHKIAVDKTRINMFDYV